MVNFANMMRKIRDAAGLGMVYLLQQTTMLSQ